MKMKFNLTRSIFYNPQNSFSCISFQWVTFLALFSDLFPKLIRIGKQTFLFCLSHCCSGPPSHIILIFLLSPLTTDSISSQKLFLFIWSLLTEQIVITQMWYRQGLSGFEMQDVWHQMNSRLFWPSNSHNFCLLISERDYCEDNCTYWKACHPSLPEWLLMT